MGEVPMGLRRSAFRAAKATATMVVVAAATSAVPGAPSARAAVAAHIAVIGDSYTAGSTEGGNGSMSWTAQAWKLLARRGIDIRADVAAEGGAGYGQPGNHGSIFQDLTARAVRRDDQLVVFFGSRNDQPVNPQQFPEMAAYTFHLAHFGAPDAKVLVIGPPWPSATPPPAVMAIRDSLRTQAAAMGATFVDPIAESWFVGRPDLIGHDGVHPTDAGHTYMAEKIAPLIYSELTTGI